LFFPPPLLFAEDPQRGLGEAISRRGLRRKLPFLPGPCQVFIKYSIISFGDDPKKFKVQKQAFVSGQEQGWIPYTGQDKIILHDFSRHRQFSGQDKLKQDPL
jgi:hypothetical protein